jgi:hypothetical protein
MPADRIVAVCLLSQSELERYGSGLKKVFPVEGTPCFDELLRLLDEADRRHWRGAERTEALTRLHSQDND